MEARTVLLTGASSGLGLAIARLLLRTENRVILTARESSLHRFGEHGITESERVWLRPLDVTDDSQRRAVVEEADRRWGGIDVLINNAGVAYRAVVEHVREEDRLEQMNVNFRSPMELARCVLPGMRKKRRGHIISVSSVSGMMAMPTMAVYSASKFALEGATEALWYETRPWGICVSLVQPGFIQSSSFQKVRYTLMSASSQVDEDDPYHGHYENMAPFIGSVMRRASATPETVAKVVLKTMERDDPPLRVPATLDARVFFWLRRLLPRGLYHWLLYRNLPRIGRWGPQGSGRSSPTARYLPSPSE